MKSIYIRRQWQEVLVNKIQNPAKAIFTNLAAGKLATHHIPDILTILKGLKELPAPEEDIHPDHNTQILINVRNDFFRHCTLDGYKPMFTLLINFVIGKYRWDTGYRGMANWFLAELIRRGWQFPEPNDPPARLWKKDID